MISPKPWLIVRVALAAGLVCLLVLFPVFLSRGYTRAAAKQPLLQSTPDYPNQGETQSPDNGYPGAETDTPSANQPTQASPNTPTVTPTITLTPTLVPNTFQTEDAEMGGAKGTAAAGTPAATITPYASPTLLKTQARGTPTKVAAKKKGGLALDWGIFWIGFSLPVMVACGAVLYMLDRRPDFFKPAKKR